MKTTIKLFLLLCMTVSSGFCQDISAELSPSQKEVATVVVELFDAMRESDTVKLKKAFTENPEMYTSYTSKDGKPVLVKGDYKKFISSIGAPHEKIYDEKTWNYKVNIDGNLAQVWTEYAFYLGDTFSHCGVDAFHFTKTEKGEWKIFHLVDTRRRNNCDVPENLK